MQQPKRLRLKNILNFVLLLVFITPNLVQAAPPPPLAPTPEPSISSQTLPVNDWAENILAKIPTYHFDKVGQLYYRDPETGNDLPIPLHETNRHETIEYTPVKRVLFFIIHYDGAAIKRPDGKFNTVFNTLRGLNDGRLASVHFCVDSYPTNPLGEMYEGMGVIMTQAPNPMPYRGRHVIIGKDKQGNEDRNAYVNAEYFEIFGIRSNLIPFALGGNKDIDGYSLAMEMTGEGLSKDFPFNFPPDQEIANTLGLIIAVANRYNLKVWDILGHNEVQQKPDPGEEFMLTLRYLLGIIWMRRSFPLPAGFLNDQPYDYFARVRWYHKLKMADWRYMMWNRFFGMDSFIEALDPPEVALPLLGRRGWLDPRYQSNQFQTE